jgi:8-oxo-dGTP pyrophosphatase MutT (NUDIX family)
MKRIRTNYIHNTNYANYNFYRKYRSDKNIVCINCKDAGHTFKTCKKPITSYGVLCVKKNGENLEFLLVQRKDTIGYVDFLRGKYTSLDNCKILLEEMTYKEHLKITNNTFDMLWEELWITKTCKTYKNEYVFAKAKFEMLDISRMIDKTMYIDTEYDIPKGRPCNNEKIRDSAVREFMEETGYKHNEFVILDKLNTISETFLGSNGVWYKHVYYYAVLVTDRISNIGDHPLQCREIKGMMWGDFKKCVNAFRLYDKTKRSIFYRARKDIQNLI